MQAGAVLVLKIYCSVTKRCDKLTLCLSLQSWIVKQENGNEHMYVCINKYCLPYMALPVESLHTHTNPL